MKKERGEKITRWKHWKVVNYPTCIREMKNKSQISPLGKDVWLSYDMKMSLKVVYLSRKGDLAQGSSGASLTGYTHYPG